MAILEIITGAANPILRKRSQEIGRIEKNLKKFAKDLKATMIKKDGLGLAAPQVGQNIRMIAVTLNHGTKNPNIAIMINPEIINYSAEIVTAEEGCLSLPGQYSSVPRFKKIKLKYLDLEGNEIILDLEGLNARIPQHEIDHLDGILFIDRVKVTLRPSA